MPKLKLFVGEERWRAVGRLVHDTMETDERESTQWSVQDGKEKEEKGKPVSFGFWMLLLCNAFNGSSRLRSCITRDSVGWQLKVQVLWCPYLRYLHDGSATSWLELSLITKPVLGDPWQSMIG